MDLAICKICKEPIWTFLCVDCIAEDVKKFVPKRFARDFSSFHGRFTENFQSFYDNTHCLKCKHSNPVAVCPYCYLTEVFSLLYSKEPILAKRLVRFLPFHRHHYSESDARTLTELENNETAYGMCDQCGESSDSLEKTDDGWVCEDCRW